MLPFLELLFLPMWCMSLIFAVERCTPVCLSVTHIGIDSPVLYQNGLTYRHNFSLLDSPSNIHYKIPTGLPLVGAVTTGRLWSVSIYWAACFVQLRAVHWWQQSLAATCDQHGAVGSVMDRALSIGPIRLIHPTRQLKIWAGHKYFLPFFVCCSVIAVSHRSSGSFQLHTSCFSARY